MIINAIITPDQGNSVSIIDKSEYLPEEDGEIRSWSSFKYSETNTVDVLKYISTEKEILVNTYFSNHMTDSDSINIPLKVDGFYVISHLVIPTVNWFETLSEEDKADVITMYQNIYLTDGYRIFKYSGNQIYEVDIETLVTINWNATPTGEYTYYSTVSTTNFKIFNTYNLKRCYVYNAREILNSQVGQCDKIDDRLRFNRDFLWMTLNVINFYLEDNYYSEAQVVLEQLSCYQFCPHDRFTKEDKLEGCGCHH